jgi:hypothetical protein
MSENVFAIDFPYLKNTKVKEPKPFHLFYYLTSYDRPESE